MLVVQSLYGRIACACVAAIAIVSVSCDRRAVLERVEDQYARGNCREAAFIVRHHFRRGGERTPELLFAGGRALLCLGNESEAADYFAAASRADSAWAPRIADVLRDEALASFEQGQAARGRRFLLQAVRYRQELDFGAYNAVAGTMMIEQKDYHAAVRFLGRYLEQHPDTAGAAAATLSLGEAYEGLGETLGAIELYTDFQQRFPNSRLISTVRYRLEKLLFEAGEEFAAAGDYEEAHRILARLASTADNPTTLEKTYFLLAGIAEAQEDYERAVSYYWEIVHLNPGASGRLVEHQLPRRPGGRRHRRVLRGAHRWDRRRARSPEGEARAGHLSGRRPGPRGHP